MVNLRRLAQTAQKVIDQQGGTDALKEKAERMKTAAQGPGSMSDKAKAAAEIAREKPNQAAPVAGDDVTAPVAGPAAPAPGSPAPKPDPAVAPATAAAAGTAPTATADPVGVDTAAGTAPAATPDPAAEAPGEVPSEPAESVPDEKADEPPETPPAPEPDDAKPNPDGPEDGSSEDR